MLKEFRAFIMRGNVLDLAVAVIIGAAFAAIVKSLTDDVIMPIVGALTGGLDFSEYYVILGKVPATMAGVTDYATLRKAGVPLLGYGAFLTSCVSFVILAAIIFMLIRTAERAFRMAMATKAVVPPTPEDVVLLREIRDELKRRAV
jgi:large conductance mechanosensitive channel